MKRNRIAVLTLLAIAFLMLAPHVASAAEGSDTSAFAKYAAQGSIVAIAMSFAFGVVASLTPCVFPMVPITVAIFGATESTSRSRGAALSLTFVMGIATLLTPLGVGAALSGKLLGSALGNPWVVSAIAIIFVVLASSMFGAFEMALPSGLNNKLATVGGVGFKGAFVLGLVMGLIAMPCTGPFLTGLVTWIATTRDWHVGGLAMFSFSMGLGLVFFVAGAFAVNLPKGGAWMLGIKWASGVALAYMALAYLRDAFPVVRHLANPSTAYGATAGVVLAIGLVLGSIHVAAERRKSPIAHLSKPMKFASIIPAIAGAFMFITWFNLPKSTFVPQAMAASATPAAGPIAWQVQAGEDAARAKAIVDKKPVLVDFGAEWCKACKELEEQTWPDARVQNEASRFVAIKVDATDDDDKNVKALQAKYKVVGLPTVVLIDSSGNETARFNEFFPPERFLATAKNVK